MALRLLSRCCGSLERSYRRPAAHRRQRRAPRRIRRCSARIPIMDFPASNLSTRRARGQTAGCEIFVKFLGLLGPQGALPLATTEESLWLVLDARRRVSALPRHLQSPLPAAVLPRLGGRAPDRPARPPAERPLRRLYRLDDRHRIARPIRDLDSVPDIAKLAFAGLMAPQAKTASRLRGFVRGLFGVAVEIDEFVGIVARRSSASERTQARPSNSGLGADMLLGAQHLQRRRTSSASASTSETIAQYRAVPADRRTCCEPLADAVFFYIGDAARMGRRAGDSGRARSSRCGSAQFGQLGWTSWMAPNWTSRRPMRCPLHRRRSRRAASTPRRNIVQASGEPHAAHR